LVALDPGDLYPEAQQRARLAGVLSPNGVRREEGRPASTDPTADSIGPPVPDGKPCDGSKIARLGDRRARL